MNRNKDGYKVIHEFECYGKNMVIVRIGNNVHVIPMEEWKVIYGRIHQNRWKSKVDWNKFKSREKYKQEKAS